jgi:hypothetical protein
VSAPLDRVLERLGELDCRPRPRKSGRGYTARCPAHDDGSPSLSVREGDDGRALLHCFAGCELTSIREALGLTLADLFHTSDARHLRAAPPRRRLSDAERLERDIERARKDGKPIGAWEAWLELGGSLAEGLRPPDPIDDAQSWITFRARDAFRVGDLDTLGRLLDALEGEWPEGHRGVWLLILLEVLTRDAWWAGDRQALARALHALDGLDALPEREA